MSILQAILLTLYVGGFLAFFIPIAVYRKKHHGIYQRGGRSMIPVICGMVFWPLFMVAVIIEAITER